MPRSGSTLVEQIISAHSLVTTGGELNLFKFGSEILNNNNVDAESLENFKKYYSELKITLKTNPLLQIKTY